MNKDVSSVYMYYDESNTPLYKIQYFTDGTFCYLIRNRRRHYVEGVPKTHFPYNLKALLNADPQRPIYFVGNEADADALIELDNLATCGVVDCMGGEVPLHWERYFAGKTIIYLASRTVCTKEVAKKGYASFKSSASWSYLIEPDDMEEGESFAEWLSLKEWGKAEFADWMYAQIEALTKLQAEVIAESNGSPQPPGPGLVEVETGDQDAEEDRYEVGWKEFPLHCLPDPMASYVSAIADAIKVNPAYVALPSLVTAGGLVGNARLFRLNDTWTEPFVFFGCLIADSSTRKTAAYEWACNPASKLDFQYAKEHKFSVECWKDEDREWTDSAQAKANGTGEGAKLTRPRRPNRKRIIIEDITTESIVRELDANPRGLIMIHDELVAWFRSFGRYKASSQSGGDFSFWLKAFRAARHTYDRKSGDQTTLTIPRAAVSVYGAIQPRVMGKVLNRDYFESGLTSRLLLMMPPKKAGTWDNQVLDIEVVDAYEDLMKKLHEVDWKYTTDAENQPKLMLLTPDGNEAWRDFYNPWQQEQYYSEGDITSLMAKLEAYCARFAALFSLCDFVTGRSQSDDVGPDHIRRGIELANWFKAEAERVYAYCSLSDDSMDDEALVGKIKENGGVITARQLYLKNKSKYRSTDGARAVLMRLSEAGKLTMTDQLEGRHVGQRTTYFTTQLRGNAGNAQTESAPCVVT